MTSITEPEIYERLKRAVKDANSLRKFARKHGYSATYVSQVMTRKLPISPNLAAIVGVQRIEVWETTD